MCWHTSIAKTISSFSFLASRLKAVGITIQTLSSSNMLYEECSLGMLSQHQHTVIVRPWILPIFPHKKTRSSINWGKLSRCHRKPKKPWPVKQIGKPVAVEPAFKLCVEHSSLHQWFDAKKLTKQVKCSSCIANLTGSCTTITPTEQDYCRPASNVPETTDSFLQFINNGSLNIPSKFVVYVVRSIQ